MDLFKKYFAKIDSRLNFSEYKIQYLGLILLALAVPLTVILSGSEQDLRSNASTKDNVLQAESSAIIEKSNSDEEPTTTGDPIKAEISANQETANDQEILSKSTAQASGVSKPNIIVIMIDDLGAIDGRLWNYTPTIKSLFVNKGTKFTNYYGESPLCCPGRANFLTGQHTLNNKVVENDPFLFKPGMTIATQLQKVGYNTFIAGKYLNGTELLSDKTPPGWNNAFIYSGGTYNYDFYLNGTRVYRGSGNNDYSTNYITQKALVALKDAPANKPIFGVVMPWVTHSEIYSKPYPVPAREFDGYVPCQAIPRWKPANYNETDVSDKSSYIRKLKNDKHPANGWPLVSYCEALMSIDEMVRKIRNELNNQGRLENTVFVLTADNGMNFGIHRLADKKWPYSTQLPLYVYWPSGLGTSPKTITNTISNIDMAPTFCAIGGCKMGPYQDGQSEADGINFLPVLKGEKTVTNRHQILEAMPKPINYVPSWYSVRTTNENPDGMWHYIVYQNGEKELYDISGGPCHSWRPGDPGDPCELNNLLGSEIDVPASVGQIRDKLHTSLNQLKKQKGFNTAPKLATPMPTVTPTPTLTPSPTLSPTPTQSVSPTLSPVL